jgi:DNA-binding response OmpR family regulator
MDPQFRCVSFAGPESRGGETLTPEPRDPKDPPDTAADVLHAGIIHDLNNLLTVINGYGEMLLKSSEMPEKVRQGLTVIRGAGERAASLTRGLMAVSRGAYLEPALVYVNETVNELVALAEHLLPDNVQLFTVAAPDLPPVLADGSGILQVLLNLLTNSRDAMPLGGRIEIETARFRQEENSPLPSLPSGEYVVLAVRDNGTGMDEPTRRRIFEPFYTTKAAGSSMGLGLPMVQYIVKQSRGHVFVDSAQGKGASVRIYLPAAETGTPAAKADTARQTGTPVSGGETILMVEDDPDLANLMRDILRSLGYTVLDARSAGEAAELSDGFTDPIDLLLTDVSLPGSHGWELADSLRKSRPGLPVLYISGFPTSAEAGDAPRPGTAFLGKPFSPAELEDRVRTVLDRHRRKRVLLVDDEPGVRMFAGEVLRQAGYDVVTGDEGNVALSLVRSQPFDLAIIDLVMPEREGLDTMMRLRESHPGLPIIAISGAFGGRFLHSASMLGARATLAKPFSGEDLLNVVRTVLGG